jgi:hypothetical protein
LLQGQLNIVGGVNQKSMKEAGAGVSSRFEKKMKRAMHQCTKVDETKM